MVNVADFQSCNQNYKYDNTYDGITTVKLFLAGAHPEQANPKTESNAILDGREEILVLADVEFCDNA